MAGNRGLRPTLDRVLVKRDEPEGASKGGILLPDTAKDKPKRGTVVEVGPGAINSKGERNEMEVKPGDRVIFSSYAGGEIEFEGQVYVVISQADILAVY